jgi:hypothetical protein
MLACYRVVAPRMNEMATWLTCNDVEPNLVPYRSDVFVESADGEKWIIRHQVYVRTELGALTYDAASREYVCEERVVPLLNDPPMWWLEEAAPTGGGAAPAGPTGAEAAVSEETVAESAPDCD